MNHSFYGSSGSTSYKSNCANNCSNNSCNYCGHNPCCCKNYCNDHNDINYEKSYAQYSNYHNLPGNVTIDNRGGITFYKKTIENGNKIELKNGKVNLKKGSYMISFFGVILLPIDSFIELTIIKNTTEIVNTLTPRNGQITIQTIVKADSSGATIEIRNISGIPIVFQTTSPNNKIISPYIIIQEI